MQSSPQPAERGRISVVLASLGLITSAVAVASIALVLLTAALRITYPYELEWMEGGILEHVARIRTGGPIYVEPTFRFVPFIYPPLYYYLSAAVMQIAGDGFLGPRLVSLTASIGCTALIFLFVYRETGRKLPAICAAALYAATFKVTEGWFDLARVDGLFPFFVLSGAFLIRFGNRVWLSAAAGLLLTCAFFTKQSALVFAAPLLLFQLIYQPRRFPALVATSVVLCGLLAGYLHWRSDGWFTYYVFALPRQHPLEWWSLAGFWTRDLLPRVPLALSLIAVLMAVRYKRWWHRPAAGFYVALGLGGFGASWLSRLHTGGGVNVIMPALAVTAIFFGLAVAYLPEIINGLRNTGRPAKGTLQAAVLVAVVVQLLLLASNPWKWVPTDADRKAGDRLVGRIGEFKGDVIVPTAPYLAALGGKPTTAHRMALMDVLRATGSAGIKQHLLADVHRELRDPRCEAILLCQAEGWLKDASIAADFEYVEPLIDSPQDFRPKSGSPEFVPILLFLRKETTRCQIPVGKTN